MTLPLHGFQDWQNPLHTADLQTDVNFTNINAGATFTTPVYDMRPYQSVSLILSALSNTDPKTNWGDCELQITWYANSIGSQIVYQERMSIFPQGSLGAFASPYGRVMARGPVFGPYMQITAFNNGPDQISFTYRVIGNTKPAGQREVINTDISGHGAFDQDVGTVAQFAPAVAAGAQANTTMPIAPGPAFMSVIVGASTFAMNFVTPSGSAYQAWSFAAGAETHQSIVLPKCATRILVANTGGVNSAITVDITSARLGM